MFNEYVKKEGNGNVKCFVIQYSSYDILCAICISSSSVHPIVEQTQEERQNFDVWWHEEHSNEK